ncbi:MAG TPA: BamA/TamA family outer membrane protein [Kofleriaceae bacterium]|jgi:outer membrane protein assembly factor BamA
MSARALQLTILVGIGALAACHHRPPHKPGDAYLAHVEFHGNKHVSDRALLAGLEIHRAQSADRPADPYAVQQDVQRIKGQYNQLGYFEVDVTSRTVRKGDADTVAFQIEEGVRSRVHITITGIPNDPDLREAAIRRALPLKEGGWFDYEAYDLAKPGILAVLQDAGYARATMTSTVNGDPATHTANIHLDFTAGPKCTFGIVEVEGIAGDLRDAILWRVKWRKGETYSNRLILRTQRDIYSLNRFSTVQIQPAPGNDAVVNIKIAVSESARHEVSFGGGAGVDPISYEVRGRATYQIAGFPTPLDTLTLEARPAYAYLRDGSGFEPRMRALVKLERQDLWLTHAIGSAQIGYDYLAYEGWTQYGPEALLSYDMRVFTRRLLLHGGYLFHYYDFSHIADLLDPTLQEHLGITQAERVGALQQSIILDLRNHPIETRYGLYAELKVTEGSRAFGGAYQYTQIEPDVRGYLPAGPVVFAARVKYGSIYGDAPPTQRFYAGGANSNRGFPERELSPGVTGDYMGSHLTIPYGGAGMIDSSAEVRFPIMTIKQMPLNGVTFLDAGDVTDTASELNLGNLNYAVGVGLRLLTVIGPARVDFGYRLNRTGADDPYPDSRFAFHISLGEAF